MKYLIWYDASSKMYSWGDETAYHVAISNSADNAILAEEFINTSSKIVDKITAKLNQNLVLVQ